MRGDGSILSSPVPLAPVGFDGAPQVPALGAPWLALLAGMLLGADALRRRAGARVPA